MYSYLQLLNEEAKNCPPLLWVLNSTQFNLADGVPLSLEERLSAALSILAIQGNQNLIIEHPNADSRLTVISTIGLLVANFAQSHIGRKLIKNDVVLITRRVGQARSELEGVKLERTNLTEIWQIEKSQSAAQAKDHQRPRLLISTPRPGNIINYSNENGVLIIDGSHPLTRERLADLLADDCFSNSLKILILPLGYSTEFNTSKWPRWRWYTDRTTYLVTPRSIEIESENFILPQQQFLICEDSQLDEQLADVRSRLSRLSHLVGTSPPVELLQAWGIYNRLASLSVPLGQYEDYSLRHPFAIPIKNRIKHLAESEIRARNSQSQIAMESQWRSLLEAISAVYENLKGDIPSKFWGLANLVEESINNGFTKPLTLVCPTQIEGNLLLRHLDSVCTNVANYLHPNALKITTPKQLASHPEWQQGSVATSSVYSWKWRFLNLTLFNQTRVLYPHEIEVEQAVIRHLANEVNESATDDSRVDIINILLGRKVANPQKRDADAIYQVVVNISGIDSLPPRKPARTLETTDLLSPTWAWDAEDITFVPPIINGDSNPSYRLIKAGSSEWLRVLFTNGKRIEVPADHTFDVLRRVTGEIEECSATALVPGDNIVLVSDGKYSRLFERIVEALEADPKYALLSVWLNLWEMAKGEALEVSDNRYSTLHRLLRDRGIKITEQAIRTWYSGVMAPRSEEAIYAMIGISGNKAAIAHQVELRSALGHIRGMRRQIGRKIRQMIRNVATGDEIKSARTLEDFAIEDVIAASERVVVENIYTYDVNTIS